MEELLKISGWSDKMIEWETGLRITLADIWGMRYDVMRAGAVRKYVRDRRKSVDPQDFIDHLARQPKYNRTVSGAILNALTYDDGDSMGETVVDTSALGEPLNCVGLGAKGGSLKVNGGLGYSCLEGARDVSASVEGPVGSRFAAHSRKMSCFLKGDAGELFGWGSSDLYSIVMGDVGFNVYRESYDGSAVIYGNLTSRDFGCKARGLKARVLGNAKDQGHMRDSSGCRVVFHKDVGRFLGEQAEGLDATVLGNIKSIGFAYHGNPNIIRCAGSVEGFGSPLGIPGQPIIYVPIGRELSREELERFPPNILVQAPGAMPYQKARNG